MVGTSKILTVSYGTFSCTLEGFDDPFSTMRSIAEYFRDLAAEDRYFGAEPPQPDAEMLHRIAETEIQRRVESRVQENSVHLRQLDDDVEPAPLPSFEEMESEAEQVNAPIDDVPTPAASNESVAEKLSRIRAVVSKSADANVVAEDAELEANEPVDATETADWTEMSDALRAEADEIGMDVAAEDTEDETADDVAAAIAAFAASDESEETDVVEDEQESTFVATDEAEGDGLDAHSEADEVETTLADDTSDNEEAAQIIKLTREDFDAVSELAESEEPTGEDVDEETADEVSEESYDPWTQVSQDDVPEDDLVASAEETAEDDALPTPEFGELNVADESWGEAEVHAEDDTEEETSEAPAEEDEDLTAGIRAAIGETSLDDDAEDDLMEEIADAERVDAIVASSSTDVWDDEEDNEMSSEDSNEDVGEESPGMLAARARLGDLADADEETSSDVERLMDETDSKMEDSEGSRRRSAIAHLKAAVAATKADRLLKRVTKREANEAEEQEQYREDLSAVVRPKRPEATTEHSERPQLEDAAAPLMLVSELRVDEDSEEPETQVVSVRPRRISADQEDAGQSGEGDKFAEFAAKMDAHELPDLLEAAAAFSAFVEGNPHFSRPQLMKRVARFDTQAEFTREAGLRSFGQLLRQGKIQKLKRGQFTIAETSRFNPDARIAGE